MTTGSFCQSQPWHRSRVRSMDCASMCHLQLMLLRPSAKFNAGLQMLLTIAVSILNFFAASLAPMACAFLLAIARKMSQLTLPHPLPLPSPATTRLFLPTSCLYKWQ